jgi:hypothetical protein
VQVAKSAGDAEKRVFDGRYDALVISDDVGTHSEELLIREARTRNPRVTIVLTGTGVTAHCEPCDNCWRLEKPFELRQLAHVLGVPEAEIPHRV